MSLMLIPVLPQLYLVLTVCSMLPAHHEWILHASRTLSGSYVADHDCAPRCSQCYGSKGAMPPTLKHAAQGSAWILPK